METNNYVVNYVGFDSKKQDTKHFSRVNAHKSSSSILGRSSTSNRLSATSHSVASSSYTSTLRYSTMATQTTSAKTGAAYSIQSSGSTHSSAIRNSWAATKPQSMTSSKSSLLHPTDSEHTRESLAMKVTALPLASTEPVTLLPVEHTSIKKGNSELGRTNITLRINRVGNSYSTHSSTPTAIAEKRGLSSVAPIVSAINESSIVGEAKHTARADKGSISRTPTLTLVNTLSVAVRSAIAFAMAAVVGVILVLGADWFASHTGPLALQDGSTAELDALSSIMAFSASRAGDDVDALTVANLPVIKNAVTFTDYKVQRGDTISGISLRYGLSNISTIIAVNGVSNARAIQAGKIIRIPSMDGIIHTVKSGNTLESISAKYNVSVEDILDVNDLSTKVLDVGQEIFIPGATMDNTALREAMGDLFKCPISVRYRISSYYGWRADPFTGVRSYHSGVDMACSQGTPIKAAMGGKVITAGWSNVFGNYVIVDHRNGYQSLYGHMSRRIANKGQVVNQGDLLGLVGSTGYSTGPHLHFTVYKHGKLTDPLVLLRR